MAILLALVSSILYGTGDFLGGLASRRAPVLAVTALSQGAGLLALLIAAPFVAGAPAVRDLAWALAAGLTGSLGVVLMYAVFARGAVSTAAPFISLVAIAIPVTAGIAGGERPGPLALAGIALAVIAVVTISATPGHSDTPRTPVSVWALAVASGVLIGAFLVCIARIGAGSGLLPLCLARATGTLTLLAVLVARRAPVRASWPQWRVIAGCGAADVAANLLYLWAAQRGALSLVATIVSLAPASTVVLAQIVLRERLARWQQAGVAIALAAIALLARGGGR
jgi:drug/metabolite transporter (DMT)-like permease